jgi:Activator of Hsp90 ATPase homolog 1-like protein
MKLEDLTLDVEQHVDVLGTLDDVFKSVLYRFGEGNVRPDGEPLHLQIEPFAGGRWFRDRGEGVQHLWGHVQVIKPPVLLELSGPMFMSYPALNHIEIKLEQIADGTRVTLRHRAIGLLDPAHKEGVKTGWGYMLDAIKNDFVKSAGTPA